MESYLLCGSETKIQNSGGFIFEIGKLKFPKWLKFISCWMSLWTYNYKTQIYQSFSESLGDLLVWDKMKWHNNR